jgi:hypothetical protein
MASRYAPVYQDVSSFLLWLNLCFQLGYWFALVLVLATQLTGFGLAGICRRFLVWPASMVWPQNLVACTLLNTLHAEDDESTGGMTRYRYFMLVTTAAFFWFFLPGPPPFFSYRFKTNFV